MYGSDNDELDFGSENPEENEVETDSGYNRNGYLPITKFK